MIRVIGFFCALVALGCGPAPEPAPPHPPDATCEAACTNLQELGCEEGKPSPGGVPCLELCESVTAELGPGAMPTRCVAQAPSCSAARACR